MEYILIHTAVEYKIDMSKGEMVYIKVRFGDDGFYEIVANQMDPLAAWVHNIIYMFNEEGTWPKANLEYKHTLDSSFGSGTNIEVIHGFKVEKPFYGMTVSAWGNILELQGNPKIFSVTSSEGTLGVMTLFFGDGVYHIQDMTERQVLFAHMYHQVGKYIHTSMVYNHVSHNSTSTPTVFMVTTRQPRVVLTSTSPVGVPDGNIQFMLEITPWGGTTEPGIQLDWNFNDGNSIKVANAKNLSLWLPHIQTYVYNVASIGDKTISVNITTFNEHTTYQTSVRIEQVITGANVDLDTTIVETGYLVIFTVTVVTGSHVTFNMSYNDGQFQLKSHIDMFANMAPIYFYHYFPIPGVYNPTICVFNLISNDCKTVDHPLYVQNRIVNFVLLNPPSLISLDINGSSDVIPFNVSIPSGFVAFPKPTNVSIQWHFSTGENYFSNAVSTRTSFSESFIFHLSHVGKMTITLNCSNYINFIILSSSIHIYQKISGLNVSIDQPFIKVGKEGTFTVSLHTGSEVVVDVDFGDGLSGQFNIPHVLAQISGLTFSHIYSSIGNYSITLSSRNAISTLVYSTALRVFIKPDINSLSLTFSSSFIGKLPSGVLQFTINLTSNVIRTELFAKWFFGSTIFSPHFEYLSHLSQGVIQYKVMTFSYAYLGTHSAHALIDNAVSSKMLYTNFTLQEQIEIKSIQSNTTVAQSKDTIEFVVLLNSGSHVGVRIDSGDGNLEIITFMDIINAIKLINVFRTKGVLTLNDHIRIQIDTNSIRGSSYGELLGIVRQVWITHRFDIYGIYHMTVIINNDISSDVIVTSSPIIIQNTIRNNMAIQCNQHVKTPPGIITCFYATIEPHPSHVQCSVHQDGRYINTSVIRDQPNQQQFLYKLLYLNLEVSEISFNCSNLVSTMTHRINVTMIQTIQGMILSVNKSTYALDETIILEIYLTRGSYLNLYIDFKDGNIKHYLNNETNILQNVFHVSHTYAQTGLFAISVHCTNIYSETAQHIIVEVLPVLHNITISGPMNAIVGSTSLFKLDYLVPNATAIFNWTLNLGDAMIDSVVNTLEAGVYFKCEKHDFYIVNLDMRNDISFYSTSFNLHCVYNITGMIILATGKLIHFSMDSIVVDVNAKITFSISISVHYCHWYLNETILDGNNYITNITFIEHGIYELLAKCKTPLNTANDSISIFVQDIVDLTSVQTLTEPNKGENIVISITFQALGSPYCLQLNMGDYRKSVYYGTLCDQKTLEVTVEANTILVNITYDTLGEYTLGITVKNYVSESHINMTIVVNNKPCFPPHLTMTCGGENMTKPLLFMTSEPIHLTSVIQDIELTCKLTTNVIYSWQVERNSLHVIPESTQLNQSSLVLAANKLIIGNYVITLAVEMAGTIGTLTMKTLYMTIVYPPITLTIQGGASRKVSWSSELLVIGNINDPVSLGGYVYNWSCHLVGFIDQSEDPQIISDSQESSCFTGATFINSLTDETLKMSTDHLRVGVIYQISVTVKDDQRKTSGSQLINLVEGLPPALNIQ